MKPPLHRSLSRLTAGLVFLLAALLVGLHLKSFKQPEKGYSSSAPAPVSIQTSDAGPPLETATRRVVNAASDTGSSKAFAVTKELRDWLREYKRVAAHNSSFLVDGLAIASRRRAVMRELFVSAPEAALEQSLSIDEYEQAPEQMKPFLEKNFSALGNYTCFPICPGTEGPGVLRRRELVPNDLKLSDGSQLKVFVVGARKEIGSKRDLPVQGISLDGLAVMRDGVFQRLSTADAAASRKYFESAQADSSKSFVTGKEISGEPTLALAGGKLFSFESERELVEFDRAVARLDAKPGPRSGSRAIFALPYQADGSTGGFNLQAADMEASAAAADWTLTPKKVFLIRVDFSDKTGDPISKADAEAALNGEVRASISDMSYGRTTISGTASTMVYRLPQSSDYYADKTAAGYGGESFKSLNDELLSDAKVRFRAERSGADATINIGASDSEYGDYDVVGVTFADIGAYNAGVKYAGLASLGAGDLWMQKSNDAKVYVHEFGHVYGLGHSNFWLTTDGSVVGAGSEKEYGDIYDVMGGGELPRGHFHPQAKKRLLWIDDPQWQDASLSGDGSWSFRLHRIDSSDTEQKLRGIRIRKSAAGSTDPEYYWIGYRASYTDNMNLMKGAYLLWQRAGSEKCCLIDSTPATPGEKTDAALFLGRTYSDTAAKAHITTLASGGSLGSEYIDVQINLGTFAGNQSPVLAEVAGPTTGWARANLEFTASASDVNEDTLSYFWSFSDGTLIGGTGASAAQVAHAFVMGGNYQVSVTVSDMKGGTVTRSKTVTVQDPSQNFAQRDSGTLGDLRSIASNGLLAVAVGTADSSGDSAVIRTSSDGIIWTARGVLESTLNLQLESVHWSGDRFVAVGQDANPPNWYGVIYTSENGLSWTRRYMDSQPGRPLSCVTSGNGVYIAGGEGGSLLSSSDGVLWEAVSLLPSTHKAAGVAFGNGTFVLTAHLFDSQAKAYSGGGKVYTSENGLQWQDRTAGAGIDASWQDLRSIAFLNDRFIASGWYSKLRFSTDGGKTFSTTRTRNEEADVLSYHNGLYFALGTERVGSGSSASTSQVALYSNDGANWSQSSSFVLGGSGGAVVNGRILIVGDGGYIWQSDPLDTAASNIPPVISSVQVPASPIARKVLAFGVQASDPNNDNLHYSWDAGDGFGAGSGAEFLYSWLVGGTYTVSVTAADGRGGSKTETRAISISDPLMPFSARGTATGALNAIAASGSLAVAVGDKGKIKTSADGVTWVDRSLTSNPNLYFYAVAWDGSKFIAAGMDYDFTVGVKDFVGVVYVSSDGSSWSRAYASTTPKTILRKIGCGNGILLAGGDMGALVRSANGNAWSPVQLVAGSYDIGGIAYGRGKFALVAPRRGYVGLGDGKVLVSSDGAAWVDHSNAVNSDLNSGQDLRAISFANDRFIASGYYSKIRISTDAAQTFRAVRSEPENIDSVVYGNGIYVGVGRNQDSNMDLLFVSKDGARWGQFSAPAGWEQFSAPVEWAVAKSAAFFKDSILLVGGGSLIAQSAIFAPDLGSPTLLSQPLSAAVNPGASVTLSVTATGAGVLNYQWKKGGVNLSGGTTSTYAISSAVESDEGNYTVVVSNDVGPVTSTTATLSVNDRVLISAQPQSTVVNPGKSVNLSVGAAGSGVLSYQWKKGGVDLSGGTASTYVIASAEESNEGEYTVVVSNIVGPVTSTTAIVSVNDRVVITAQPVKSVVTVGETVSLSVTATGTGPLLYQWKKGNQDISGETLPMLKITSAQLTDSGSYQVIVQGTAGSVASNPVLVTVNPARIQAVVGEALTWTLPADPNVSSYSVTRLPPGLLFDANAGTITGTPHRAGVWVVQIKGVNGVSIVRSAQLPIQVAPLNAGLVGRFNGLVAKSAELNDNLGSRIDCVVSSSGVVSGRLISSKGSAAFIGSLKTTLSNPTEATLSVPVSLFGSGQNLQLDLLFDASSQRISGEVVLKSSVANPQSAAVAVVSGWGNSWGRFRAAGYAGDYRFYMMPDSSPADSPQGYGYGSAFVSRETGGVSLWGSLADSQRISSACALGPSGEVLMYSTLYGGSGSCVGAVSLEKGAIVPVENTIAGSLNWSKKGWGARGAKVSPQNFEATLEVQGRFFRSANSRLLNLQSARRSVGAQLGIGLTEWINQPVNLQVAGGVQIRVLIPSNIYALKMQTIDRQVGFFSGGFEIPPASLQGQKRQASFSGQIVNDVQDSKGYGFFLAPREPEAGTQLDTSILYSGKVTLDVP